MSINVGSSSQWRDIVSQNSIVVADFYADWCGPCKMIAPHFESLATKHSKPKRIAFCKVNVDNQRDVAQQNAVRAMPTFKILRNGAVIDTIQGANPPALTAAIEKAVKLAGPTTGASFTTPGRTLGGPAAPARASLGRPLKWDLRNFFSAIITFLGLYVVSLFSFDGYKSAESSQFNVHNTQTRVPGGQGQGNVQRPAQKPAFRTLADLGSD